MADCIADFMPELNSNDIQAREFPIVIFLPKAEKILKANPEG
jgi:hypothetical protein